MNSKFLLTVFVLALATTTTLAQFFYPYGGYGYPMYPMYPMYGGYGYGYRNPIGGAVRGALMGAMLGGMMGKKRK